MRNYALNFPYFIGSAITGSGVGGGTLCDFSTYFNGTSEVTEQFVIKAPLRMDLDQLSGFGAVNDLKNKDWDSEIIANIIFDEQGVSDRYFRHRDSTETSSLFSVDFASAFSELNVTLIDSAGNTFYTQSFNLPGTELNKVTLKYVLATDTLTVKADGILLDTANLNIVANFRFDGNHIAFSGGSSAHSKMLLYSYELTGIGFTSFVSNQDDGLFFVSDEGLAWTLTEDIAGASQYPGVGFVWPITTLFRQPKTAALNLNSDDLSGTFTLTSFDTAWEIVMRVNIETSASGGDRLLLLDSSMGSGNIIIDFSGSAIRAFGSDNSLALEINLNVSYAAGTDAIIKLSYDGTSTVILDVNGVTATDVTVDLSTNGLDVNRILVGAQSVDFRELECFVSCCNISLIDDWLFIGRLPTETDPDGGTFIGLTNNIVLTLDDDAPTGAYFPYFDLWPTAYLISDTACTQPVGNQELVTNLGVGVTDNGEFVFNEVV